MKSRLTANGNIICSSGSCGIKRHEYCDLSTKKKQVDDPSIARLRQARLSVEREKPKDKNTKSVNELRMSLSMSYDFELLLCDVQDHGVCYRVI